MTHPMTMKHACPHADTDGVKRQHKPRAARNRQAMHKCRSSKGDVQLLMASWNATSISQVKYTRCMK